MSQVRGGNDKLFGSGGANTLIREANDDLFLIRDQ
jgi:Ca2+-binding RTX toxin-like protein